MIIFLGVLRDFISPLSVNSPEDASGGHVHFLALLTNGDVDDVHFLIRSILAHSQDSGQRVELDAHNSSLDDQEDLALGPVRGEDALLRLRGNTSVSVGLLFNESVDVIELQLGPRLDCQVRDPVPVGEHVEDRARFDGMHK